MITKTINRIEEFIEKLNSRYIPRYYDSDEMFSDGIPYNHYWQLHKKEIIKELTENPKYNEGYEVAKRIIDNKVKQINKLEEIIEKLNNGYIPKSTSKTEKFSDGSIVCYYWAENKEQILKELNEDPKYSVGYEIAKSIVFKIMNKINRIEEFIDKLNSGYVPIGIDEKEQFSDGTFINQFWTSKKTRIVNKINSDEYNENYELAKIIIELRMKYSLKEKSREEILELALEEYDKIK